MPILHHKKANRKQIEKSMQLAANALEMANKELQGAVILNWVLVKRAGGVITIPQAELSTDVPKGSGLKVHFDAKAKAFTFTALDQVVPPAADAE